MITIKNRHLKKKIIYIVSHILNNSNQQKQINFTNGYFKRIMCMATNTDKSNITLERYTYLPWISQHRFLQYSTIYIFKKTVLIIIIEEEKTGINTYSAISKNEITNIIKYLQHE